MNHSIAKPLGIVLLAGPLVACDSELDARARNMVFDGLQEGEREVAVWITGASWTPTLRLHDSRAWEGAGKWAAAGALGSLYGGAMAGGPFGIAIGVVLAPVFGLGGAVYGVVAAEPEVQIHRLDDVEAAQALVDALTRGPDLDDFLKHEIDQNPTTLGGHTLLIAPDAEAGVDRANMTVSVKTYALVGGIEDDPDVRLLIAGTADLRETAGNGSFRCEWSYEGARRRLSKWAARDAERFRAEVARAAESITTDLRACLGSGSRPGQRR